MTKVALGFLLVFVSAVSVRADSDQKPFIAKDVRGLDPALESTYRAAERTGQFKCLDGSATIPVSAINDDYCDCADGSDEPGTSACEGRSRAFFYCKNEGHVPGRILSSRVNDGLCDPECCDGSDEWATGACPDSCAEIGRASREKAEAELKTRKTGAKIRATYVNWAVNEKKRLQNELVQKRAELQAKERELETSRIALEKAEAGSKADLERRRQSREYDDPDVGATLMSALYTHSLSQKLALTRLRARTSRLESELSTLHAILSELSKGYNPNYQDMAVKAAVVGYEESTKIAEENAKEEEVTDAELDGLDNKDLDGLLLSEQVEPIASDEEGLLYRIDEYIPDALYDHWESVRDFAIDWLLRIGFLGKGSAGTSNVDGPHVAAARTKHSEVSTALHDARSGVTQTEETLKKMDEQYGPEAEWKKLENTCISQIAGDYTYELCFFGQATQKSNKDGSSNNLGKFESWKTSEKPGSYEYYTRQNYRNGATVDLSCGTSNQLLTIAEPEKCEYFFKATSPALCWPIKEEAGVKDEL